MKFGFALVSWMMQSFFCALLAIIAFTLSLEWRQKMLYMHNQLDQLLVIPIAIDALRDDTRGLSNQDLLVETDALHINDGGAKKKVSWVYTENKLIRKQQTYNDQSSRWNRTVSSLVANKISSCRFYAKNAFLFEVEITAEYMSKPLNYCIGMYNGVIK